MPGTIAGPREPPFRSVSRWRTSKPDVCTAPWQGAHFARRRLTADSRIAGYCALPARQRSSNREPVAPMKTHRVRAGVSAVLCITAVPGPRTIIFGAELLWPLLFSLAGPTKPMARLPSGEIFRTGFPVATQSRTGARSRPEAPVRSLEEGRNRRVTRWHCRPKEGIGCQAGTSAGHYRGTVANCALATHGSSLDRR